MTLHCAMYNVISHVGIVLIVFFIFTAWPCYLVVCLTRFINGTDKHRKDSSIN